MKTIEEMMAVMQAYANGKTIEFRYEDVSDWEECARPEWNWNSFDYRVKPELTYRPYKDSDECFSDVKKHGGWALTEQGDFVNVTFVGDNTVVAFNLYSFEEFFRCLWADDGSVCGVKE